MHLKLSSIVSFLFMSILYTHNLLPLSTTACHVIAPLAVGDLFDKITILQVKIERIVDPHKRSNITHELQLLLKVRDFFIQPDHQLDELTQELKNINAALWDIENAIRAKEARQEFDKEFIEIARKIYTNNSARHALKQKINQITGSSIVEEKQYGLDPLTT